MLQPLLSGGPCNRDTARIFKCLSPWIESLKNAEDVGVVAHMAQARHIESTPAIDGLPQGQQRHVAVEAWIDQAVTVVRHPRADPLQDAHPFIATNAQR